MPKDDESSSIAVAWLTSRFSLRSFAAETSAVGPIYRYRQSKRKNPPVGGGCAVAECRSTIDKTIIHKGVLFETGVGF